MSKYKKQFAILIAAVGLSSGLVGAAVPEVEAGNAISAAKTDIIMNPKLWKSAKNGDITAVEDALNLGADVNYGLSRAVKAGRTDLIRMFINHGANVNTVVSSPDWTALHWAARNGPTDAAKLLVEHGANMDARATLGWTPLHLAAFAGDIELVRFLIVNGADMNDRDRGGHGETPLDIASRLRKRGVVDVLKQIQKSSQNSVPITRNMNANGAQIENINAEEWPITSQGLLKAVLDYPVNASHPLELQMRRSVVEEVRKLLEAGADPDVDDEHGNTPLHIAASHNQVQIIKLLLEYKASVNSKNRLGNTPLHEAAHHGHKGAAIELVKHGAKVNAVNKKGETPSILASQNNGGVDEVLQYVLLQGLSQSPHNNNNKKTLDELDNEAGSSGCS